MQGKSILLIIGGGIAAYKCLDFIRRAKERGAKVRCVLTAAAQEFVTPLSAAVLSEEPAFTDLFDLKNETEIGHIRLSREADLIIVAPATADLLAKMAHGLAGDLASTVLLAADTPVLAAPAMNWRMWENPATRRNLAQLKSDGVHFVGPNEGGMACGEWGVGRMAEVDEIVAAVHRLLAGEGAKPLAGRHVLVTAGPTFEPIDPVRFIGNRSSGKQGYAIAAAAAARCACDAGGGAKRAGGPWGRGCGSRRDGTGDASSGRGRSSSGHRHIQRGCCGLAPSFGAVWQNQEGFNHAEIRLVENPDILKTVAKRTEKRPRLVIGFAAETGNAVAQAQKKLPGKGCDWIVANDVSPEGGVFGGDRNTVHLISGSAVQSWPEMSKEEVAARLMQAAVEWLKQGGGPQS